VCVCVCVCVCVVCTSVCTLVVFKSVLTAHARDEYARWYTGRLVRSGLRPRPLGPEAGRDPLKPSTHGYAARSRFVAAPARPRRRSAERSWLDMHLARENVASMADAMSMRLEFARPFHSLFGNEIRDLYLIFNRRDSRDSL